MTPSPASQFPSVNETEAFFQRQLERWEDARGRFCALDTVQTKELTLGAASISAQYNPSRIVSTGAKTDKSSIAKRACFLCAANRPPQQIMLEAFDGNFQVLVNPFPILRGHLVIASAKHEEQCLAGHYAELCTIAARLDGYIAFYNGARCGASAPDHLHFQAGKRGNIPIEKYWAHYRQSLRPMVMPGVSLLEGFACPAAVITEKSVERSIAVFEPFYAKLQKTFNEGEIPINVMVWKEGDELVTVVFLRSKHRPDCYYAAGETQLLISPGSVDMGGLLITPRSEDFEKITPEKAFAMLAEVTFPAEDINTFLNFCTAIK